LNTGATIFRTLWGPERLQCWKKIPRHISFLKKKLASLLNNVAFIGLTGPGGMSD
jgi:hypothetical protein